MQKPLSVSSLNEQIKSLLESTFLHVSVEGEVSRVTYHSSGHLYFTLKDKNSSISCVMFRGNNQRLKFRVEEGMAVIISGSISVYAPRGSYQINCVSMEPSGSGALALAYEQLKQKLQAKGYFDEEHKKVLPRFPKHVVLVTSATGAALQDMRRVTAKRWPMVKLSLCDALVQGEGAGSSIVAALAKADSLNPDVIVVGRGGGSVEDLWAFNEEEVADAVFTCKAPIVSAVGHEIDYVISDFVADIRAATPSNAMEIILPDQYEMMMNIDTMMENMQILFAKTLHKKEEALNFLFSSFKQNSFDTKLEYKQREVLTYKEALSQKFIYLLQEFSQKHLSLHVNMNNQMQRLLSQKESSVKSLQMTFEAKKPSSEHRKGYAQVVKNGKRLELQELKKDEDFELQNPTTKLKARVLEITNI